MKNTTTPETHVELSSLDVAAAASSPQADREAPRKLNEMESEALFRATLENLTLITSRLETIEQAVNRSATSAVKQAATLPPMASEIRLLVGEFHHTRLSPITSTGH